MSEKLPFEENMEQQFNKLRLPDEEQSWQKMKTLLDEEDDRRRPVFFWFNGLVWGILFLALATGAYFLFFTNDAVEQGVPGSAAQQTPATQTNDKTLTKKERTDNKDHSHSNPSISQTQTGIPVDASDESIIKKKDQSATGNTKPATSRKSNIARNNSSPQKKNAEPVVKVVPANVPAGEVSKTNTEVKPEEKLNVDRSDANLIKQEIEKETVIEKEPGKNTGKKDSVNKTRLKPAIDTSRETVSNEKYFFSAGIGIQQQIPLGGQGSVPYNVYGREASISDYIPSVFFRIHQEDKWFVMGEFRYGAPQQVNDFNYSRHSVYDTTSMTMSTTTMRLKKTYYHQLPFSFNYYVKPGLSLGLGVMYSRFYGAVSEKEIKKENVFTQAVTYSKSITNMKGFTDSFLHKSQVHLILNTDYQWKNFLLGLRFTKDIQPYIKYTQPDGMINEEKNYSLQVILRWQFWKSQ